ncbi:hypothetical protein PPERSA_10043 [Pseudocohnilembus persalinus]|uniref:Uncharacterized protein n=1 Tax=Pseudocohnilembus persalinus TaxID=266149 RepID=A0A0V0QK03_PSEPJ|nr:hypothetical protein PPERSA_10043 [Pseudocohnilembus persalinus]|eukprot:KRX02426.1 hypothetical protein PPERSA_10043 [Pseudocohnilembus persalinus]
MLSFLRIFSKCECTCQEEQSSEIQFDKKKYQIDILDIEVLWSQQFNHEKQLVNIFLEASVYLPQKYDNKDDILYLIKVSENVGNKQQFNSESLDIPTNQNNLIQQKINSLENYNTNDYNSNKLQQINMNNIDQKYQSSLSDQKSTAINSMMKIQSNVVGKSQIFTLELEEINNDKLNISVISLHSKQKSTLKKSKYDNTNFLSDSENCQNSNKQQKLAVKYFIPNQKNDDYLTLQKVNFNSQSQKKRIKLAQNTNTQQSDQFLEKQVGNDLNQQNNWTTHQIQQEKISFNMKLNNNKKTQVNSIVDESNIQDEQNQKDNISMINLNSYNSTFNNTLTNEQINENDEIQRQKNNELLQQLIDQEIQIQQMQKQNKNMGENSQKNSLKEIQNLEKKKNNTQNFQFDDNTQYINDCIQLKNNINAYKNQNHYSNNKENIECDPSCNNSIISSNNNNIYKLAQLINCKNNVSQIQQNSDKHKSFSNKQKYNIINLRN